MLLAAGDGIAQDRSSPWDKGHASRARLIAGAGVPASREAGLTIELDTGYKTYWRQPGDSGLPPVFDWSGSRNLESVDIAWPAPVRTEDASGVFYGYKHDVTLPLRVTPKDPARPVDVKLNLSYGVCREICIPASAILSLTLPPEAPGNAIIDAARAGVPVTQALGAPGAISVLAVDPGADGRSMQVAVRAPDDATLFAEAPEGWFLEPEARSQPADAGTRRFKVDIAERPKGQNGPVPVRLTLSAGKHAIETVTALDAGPASR